MSRKKSKASKPVYKKKSKSAQISIIVLIVAFAAYLIYSNFIVTNQTTAKKENKLQHSVYDFTRHGDLTFTTSDSEYITKIDIEIAEDDESRSTGMMYRAKMKKDQGMLFIFPVERYQSFWMRNTVLSLDIIFVNSNMEIVTIHENAKPFDENSYSSTKPSLYVVEVIAGFCAEHGITEGSKIVWRKI